MQTPSTEADSREFADFMRAYQDMVFTTAARLAGSDAQAEDIAQEVFLRAFEHFPDLRASQSAGGWLKTVTTNLAINHWNRHRRRWRLFSELGTPSSEEDPGPPIDWEVPDTLLRDLAAEQRRALIDDALRRLPQFQRLALVLYHFEELSYQEIAASLHVSLSKIKSDIRRARAALLITLRHAGATRDSLEN